MLSRDIRIEPLANSRSNAKTSHQGAGASAGASAPSPPAAPADVGAEMSGSAQMDVLRGHSLAELHLHTHMMLASSCSPCILLATSSYMLGTRLGGTTCHPLASSTDFHVQLLMLALAHTPGHHGKLA